MGAVTLINYYAQTQDPMRKGIVQAIVHSSIFMQLLTFVKVDGFNYEYGEQTALGAIAFRAFNGSYDPSAGIVNPKIEILRIFGGIVQIDHQLEGSSTHTNAVLAKMKAAGLFYDYNVINGNPANDPKSFYGLKSRIVGKQLITMDPNGATITLPAIDQLLDAVVGPDTEKVLVMNKAQRRAFKQLLIDAAGGATVADAAAVPGVYNGAKIQVIDEDDDVTPVLPQTETCGTATNCSSIYCIRPGKDPEGEFVQGLIRGQMIEQKPLAMVNTAVGDLIEAVAGLGVFHGRAAARLQGCKPLDITQETAAAA